MKEAELVLHFPTPDAARAFAKSASARVSRFPTTWVVRLHPADIRERLRLRLSAMDAGSITDPLAKHAEWRCHG